MSWKSKENNFNVENLSKRNAQIAGLVEQISKKGRFGDNTIRNVKGESSHVNPLEALLIDVHGKKGEDLVSKIGAGTINPETGKKEFFWQALVPFIPHIIAAAGMWKLASGKDWSPWTKQWGDRGSKEAKLMKGGGPRTFADLQDIYKGEGKYEGMDLGKMIQGLRYQTGGYSGQEMGGSDWTTALSSGLDALKRFNPLTALKEKLSPYVAQKSTEKRQGLGRAASKLAELQGGVDIGGATIGKPKDIFEMGAQTQGVADRMMAQDVAAQKKAEEQNTLDQWFSTV